MWVWCVNLISEKDHCDETDPGYPMWNICVTCMKLQLELQSVYPVRLSTVALDLDTQLWRQVMRLVATLTITGTFTWYRSCLPWLSPSRLGWWRSLLDLDIHPPHQTGRLCEEQYVLCRNCQSHKLHDYTIPGSSWICMFLCTGCYTVTPVYLVRRRRQDLNFWHACVGSELHFWTVEAAAEVTPFIAASPSLLQRHFSVISSTLLQHKNVQWPVFIGLNGAL